MVRLVRQGGADVRVRDLALRAGAARPELPLANAIHDAQRRSIRWAPEWGEVLEGHEYTLSRRAADCDGQAILLAAQFLAVGLAPVDLVMMGLRGRASTHVAVRCRGKIYDTAPDLDRSMVVHSAVSCSRPHDPYISEAESDRALAPLGLSWRDAGAAVVDVVLPGARHVVNAVAESDAYEWVSDKGEDLWQAIKAAGGVIGSAADRLLEVIALPFDALQGALLKIPGVAALVKRAKQVLGKLQEVVRAGLAAVVGDKLADLATAAFAEMIACAAGPGSDCQKAVKQLAGKSAKFATDVVVAVASDPMFWVQIAAIAVSCVAPPACAAAAAIVAQEYATKAVLAQIKIPKCLQNIAPSALVGALDAVGRQDIGALITQGVTAAKAEAERQIKNLPQRLTTSAINAAIGQAPALAQPFLERAARNGISMTPAALAARGRVAMLEISTQPKFTEGFLQASAIDVIGQNDFLRGKQMREIFANSTTAEYLHRLAGVRYPAAIERAAQSAIAARALVRGFEKVTELKPDQVEAELKRLMRASATNAAGAAAHLPYTRAEKTALMEAGSYSNKQMWNFMAAQKNPTGGGGGGGLVLAGLAAAAVAVMVIK